MLLIPISAGARSLQEAFAFLAEQRNTLRSRDPQISCGDSPPPARFEKDLVFDSPMDLVGQCNLSAIAR